MNELKKIEASLNKTLKNTDLINLSSNISEIILDTTMNEGLAKDIPIIGTIINAIKIGSNIKEQLFMKKILSFLIALETTSQNERKAMIEKTDASSKYRIKVGEKIIYIIEKCDDHENARTIGILFSAYIKKEITYGEFLKATNIIGRISQDALTNFINDDWKQLGIEEVDEEIITGLAYIEPPNISVRDRSSWKEDERYIVEGGELMVHISDIGIKIREILKP